MNRSIFAADFLDLLETGEEPPSLSEAEWSGEWKVVSLDPDRHLVLRSWEEPAKDRPAAVFTERPIALQCAARPAPAGSTRWTGSSSAGAAPGSTRRR